jgi:hypothetical protein
MDRKRNCRLAIASSRKKLRIVKNAEYVSSFPLLYQATVYTQVRKPDPQLTLQPTNQNLTLALPKGKSFPLLSKERDRFCVAEPG